MVFAIESILSFTINKGISSCPTAFPDWNSFVICLISSSVTGSIINDSLNSPVR